MLMNRTVGKIDVLTMQQYALGVILGLTFMSISILNILILICFYNLRHQAFVKNSIVLISLVATDLVNAVILTPELFLWFFLPPPNDFSTCLIKSLPFMLSNYTSLLNMTSFCVHRFVVIRKLTIGRIKVDCSKYGFVTMVIWSSAILLVSLPYMIWPNSDKVILDCRRSVFSDVEDALTMFSWLFDIPLVVMNTTLLTSVIMLKKHQRVKVNTAHDDDAETETNASHIDIETVDGHITDVQNGIALCRKVFVRTGKTVPGINVFGYDSTSDTNTDTFQNLALPHGFETTNRSNRISRSQHNCVRPSIPALAASVHQFEQIGTVNITDIESFRPDNNHTVDHQTFPHLQRSLNTEHCNEQRGHDESGHMFHDLKQVLVTMGIIVLVYDVTLFPLFIDINMGARDHNFLVPHVLNSFCFLNSFCNPLVYLVRVKEMRKEMKRLLTQCLDKIYNCCKNRNRDSNVSSDIMAP